METIIHEGKVYTIGALYLFKDVKHDQQEIGVLDSVDDGDDTDLTFRSKCGNKSEWFHKCEPLDNESVIGTIEDAPLELEDGEWYMCYTNANIVLHYSNLAWWDCDDDLRRTEYVDVKPLYKMVKA